MAKVSIYNDGAVPLKVGDRYVPVGGGGQFEFGGLLMVVDEAQLAVEVAADAEALDAAAAEAAAAAPAA